MNERTILSLVIRITGFFIALYGICAAIDRFTSDMAFATIIFTPRTLLYGTSFAAVVIIGFLLFRYADRVAQFAYGPAKKTGTCAKCGYDLRATPNQCPECGTIPSKRESISK